MSRHWLVGRVECPKVDISAVLSLVLSALKSPIYSPTYPTKTQLAFPLPPPRLGRNGTLSQRAHTLAPRTAYASLKRERPLSLLLLARPLFPSLTGRERSLPTGTDVKLSCQGSSCQGSSCQHLVFPEWMEGRGGGNLGCRLLVLLAGRWVIDGMRMGWEVQ